MPIFRTLSMNALRLKRRTRLFSDSARATKGLTASCSSCATLTRAWPIARCRSSGVIVPGNLPPRSTNARSSVAWSSMSMPQASANSTRLDKGTSVSAVALSWACHLSCSSSLPSRCLTRGTKKRLAASSTGDISGSALRNMFLALRSRALSSRTCRSTLSSSAYSKNPLLSASRSSMMISTCSRLGRKSRSVPEMPPTNSSTPMWPSSVLSQRLKTSRERNLQASIQSSNAHKNDTVNSSSSVMRSMSLQIHFRDASGSLLSPISSQRYLNGVWLCARSSICIQTFRPSEVTTRHTFESSS
mmetsp:Transcript_46673/g.131331  ORF Transcript_46673/g.131331 Transcript_46673/m.131331 type:complete len:302 (-) Transcript_46673:273-1178(-)